MWRRNAQEKHVKCQLCHITCGQHAFQDNIWFDTPLVLRSRDQLLIQDMGQRQKHCISPNDWPEWRVAFASWVLTTHDTNLNLDTTKIKTRKLKASLGAVTEATWSWSLFIECERKNAASLEFPRCVRNWALAIWWYCKQHPHHWTVVKNKSVPACNVLVNHGLLRSEAYVRTSRKCHPSFLGKTLTDPKPQISFN